ncbi:hypothetical protein Golob_007527 [Gossypium lobatum]|uniref:DUF7745 domain-containing protein n=1 Tax=Gossypium lobatum TaxID=34289 RepID=A0A7J8MCN2_9ROSI|nr:hypothetical protein [Gossypium lobatum]
MHFRDNFGDVAQLLFVESDDALLKAMVHFWDPIYRCFTFNEVDMDIVEAKHRFSGTLSQSDGITYRYSESKIER